MSAEQLQEVQVEIEDTRLQAEELQNRTREVQGDGDGRILVARRAAHGHLGSARDPNYVQNLARIASGGKAVGHCAVAGCSHPHLELDHKCRTCKKFVHNFCGQAND